MHLVSSNFQCQTSHFFKGIHNIFRCSWVWKTVMCLLLSVVLIIRIFPCWFSHCCVQGSSTSFLSSFWLQVRNINQSCFIAKQALPLTYHKKTISQFTFKMEIHITFIIFSPFLWPWNGSRLPKPAATSFAYADAECVCKHKETLLTVCYLFNFLSHVVFGSIYGQKETGL